MARSPIRRMLVDLEEIMSPEAFLVSGDALEDLDAVGTKWDIEVHDPNVPTLLMYGTPYDILKFMLHVEL